MKPVSTRPPHTVRDTDAADSLELFVITAVASILAVRGYLHLAGYPQVAAGTLHIAHMLWGGLFMLVAIVMLITFWNPRIRRGAAMLAGIGWGTFIDELGKFITKDNDYFFQPTFALIYVSFVILLIIFRALARPESFSPEEIEVNEKLRDHLSTADKATSITGRAGNFVLRRRAQVRSVYEYFTAKPWFDELLIGIFVSVALLNLIKVGWYWWTERTLVSDISPFELAIAIASGGLVWLGILNLRRSRLAAMRWFQRSSVVTLLLATPLQFYHHQLGALVGFSGTLSLYIVLRYAIRNEEKTQLKL